MRIQNNAPSDAGVPTKRGRVDPEQPTDRPSDDDQQLGIEIDNAIERPQEGQPGQPGGKPT